MVFQTGRNRPPLWMLVFALAVALVLVPSPLVEYVRLAV